MIRKKAIINNFENAPRWTRTTIRTELNQSGGAQLQFEKSNLFGQEDSIMWEIFWGENISYQNISKYNLSIEFINYTENDRISDTKIRFQASLIRKSKNFKRIKNITAVKNKILRQNLKFREN